MGEGESELWFSSGKQLNTHKWTLLRWLEHPLISSSNSLGESILVPASGKMSVTRDQGFLFEFTPQTPEK